MAEKVLDEKTRKIIFRSSDTLSYAIDSVVYSFSVKEIIETPLTDLNAINERLDGIEELVNDEKLRKHLSNISETFRVFSDIGTDSEKDFYKVLSEFVAEEKKDEFEQERLAERLANSIGHMASIKESGPFNLNELPSDFGKSEFKTKSLEKLAKQYSRFIGKRTEGPIKRVFRYVIHLNERIELYDKINLLVERIDDTLGFPEVYIRIKEDVPDKEKAFKKRVKTLKRICNESKKLRKLLDKGETSSEDIVKKVEEVDKYKEQAEEILSERISYYEIKITYEQVRNLIDIKTLLGFKKDLKKAGDFYQKITTFVLLAEEAIKNDYTRPEVVPKEENCLIIRKGKGIEAGYREGVIPNDTYLDDKTRIEVLEGPNNGGKTFDIKKAMYLAAKALTGSFVPADYLKVSVRDRIVLREKGVGDIISAMQSDCRNTKEIFPPEGEYWLIGADEAFTSTEKKGGEALVYGLINSILDQENSLMIMSSHYTNLSDAFKDDSRVNFQHFTFEKDDGEVTFPHKKVNGSLPVEDREYAIAVAESFGFKPEKLLQYAKERMKQKIS